jgi:hypothetical protein
VREGDAGAVQLVERDLRDDHARHHRAVASDSDVGEGDQVVGVLEELDQGDRTDVEIPLHQLLAELLRGVLGELEVEERARSREPPVEGQAVQELDVADARPGARIVHIVRLALMAYAPERDPAVGPWTSVGASPPVGRGMFKHSGDVILTPIAFRCLRARLVASCSLVSLAVQSLRSM